MELKEYLKLKKIHEKITQQKDQKVGQIGMLRQKLLEDFGCETLKEAKEMRSRLQKEVDRELPKFNRSIGAFEKELEEHTNEE